MILLDENIRKEEREKLKRFKLRVRQIGYDVALQGLDDTQQILPLLHRLKAVTFFTHDRDFYRRKRLHQRYALVFLDVLESQTAIYIRQFLKHEKFNVSAKRLGKVIRLAPDGIHFWTLGQAKRNFEDW